MNIELMKMVCNECGCTEYEYDENMGEKICKDCGLVLVTEMFEETVHILDTVGNVKHSSDKGKLGSVIAGKGSYKFNKFGKNSVMPKHIQNGLMHCNMVLAHVAPQLNLNDRVEELYIKLQNRGLFGRSVYEARATAVVYYALKENGTPHSFKDVCSEFNPSLKIVKRLVRKINQEHRNSVNYTPINPQYLLKQTLHKITEDIEFQRQAIKTLEFFEKKANDYNFNKGRSYYASIIYIAANINLRHDITCQKISEITGFSRWVIWRQTKAILNMIGYNNAKELKGKDINKIGE
jgi:transcription initiation factor TFIIIB Brf1 subunit/transcription initiation factor TFIIB